jgi:hypothetical protein
MVTIILLDFPVAVDKANFTTAVASVSQVELCKLSCIPTNCCLLTLLLNTTVLYCITTIAIHMPTLVVPVRPSVLTFLPTNNISHRA